MNTMSLFLSILSDWEKYDGAYGITPNLKELSDCAGKSIPNESAPIEAEGKRIREKFHLKYLFVTRSERGITCIMDGGAIHRASVAQDVFDVSGYCHGCYSCLCSRWH